MRISDWSSDVCSSDLLPPRDWKLRLLAARTLELTWESEASGAIAGGGKSSGDLFGWREPVLPPGRDARLAQRSEARRVGKECVRTRRYRWSPHPYTKPLNH